MRTTSVRRRLEAARPGRGVSVRAEAPARPVPNPSAAESGAADRLRALLEIAAELSTSFERGDVHRAILDGAARLTGADVLVLRRLDGQVLERVAARGLDPVHADRGERLDISDPGLAEILASGRPWACPDATALPPGQWHGWLDGPGRVRGVVLVPLVHGGRTIGSVTAATWRPRDWDGDDLDVLAGLATHAAAALRNVELFERLDSRAAEMRVVQAASNRMTRAKSVDAIGRIIVEEVASIVDYHNARVYLVESGDELVPIAFEGKVGEYEIVDWDVLRVKVGEGFTGWVAANSLPLCIPDANADPRGSQIPGTPTVPESMLVVPMRHDDVVIGVITLSKLGLGQFDDDDLQVLSILADQAGTALESARLFLRAEGMAEELRRILEMSQELTQTLDPRQVGALLARHLAVALGVDSCAISSWDASADRVVSLGEYPGGAGITTHPIYELAEYPETRRVLETQATVIIDVEDPEADEAEVAILRADGERLLAMLPLIAKGRSVGLVELMSKGFVPFDERRLTLARTMANEAAMALENARLYEAARSLADRDPLTGFYNHRSLYERLGEEFVRSRRARRSLSLLMLDVDDFKLVNDTFGHQFGDRCLVHLAEVVRGTLRASDIPARYGGDEFAVILPETDAAAAGVVAARITTELAGSPLLADGRGPVPITVSIGVATIGPEIRSVTDLVGLADERMYVAKTGGEPGIGRDDVIAAIAAD